MEIKGLNYDVFRKESLKIIEFEKDCEFDDEDWNMYYSDFKHSLLMTKRGWLKDKTVTQLITSFIEETFQENSKDKNDVWLKIKKKKCRRPNSGLIGDYCKEVMYNKDACMHCMDFR